MAVRWCPGQEFSHGAYVGLCGRRKRGILINIKDIRFPNFQSLRNLNFSQDDHWERAFKRPFEDVPKAPGNGLVLRQVHYDVYNKDYGTENRKTLEWSDKQSDMDSFAKENILPVIFKMDTGESELLIGLENN